MSLITQVDGVKVSDGIIHFSDSNINSFENNDLPVWSIWFSTIVLSLTFIIGIPLNGVTVLIFLRRKKLRHLVNFVLLLDCLSHIILCGICIPLQLTSVWSQPVNLDIQTTNNWASAMALQQVVGNFANLYGTFLSLSIAVLRYRRLCWKKKDKFSRLNAIKWSVSNGILAIGITFTQSWTLLHPMDIQRITLTLYAIKVTLILSSMVLVFFCYIRVSQRVWANAASQEKVMDPIKLKKSRSVHLRATIHSCVQIILIVATTVPYIYEEASQLIHAIHLVTTSNPPVTFPTVVESSPTPSIPMIEKIALSTVESMTIPLEMDRRNNDYNHLTRLMAMTLNYTLLALGTPLAYIASCHRFREQFTSILCGQFSSFYFLSVGHDRHPNDKQIPGTISNHHHNNNNTNNKFTTNQRGKSPSSPTAEIFDTNSLPRTISQRSRSKSQPMALSPTTMISSVMSTPSHHGISNSKGNYYSGGGDGMMRRASCQSTILRVHMKSATIAANNTKTNHFFSYCSPQSNNDYIISTKKLSTNNIILSNGINHFINTNYNYSSYGSSSSTSEIVGNNV